MVPRVSARKGVDCIHMVLFSTIFYLYFDFVLTCGGACHTDIFFKNHALLVYV